MANTENKTGDVVMKDAAQEEETKTPHAVPFAVDKEIQANLVLVHRAIDSLEPRLTVRALRNLTTLRKHTIHADAFKDILSTLYQKDSSIHQQLEKLISSLPAAPEPEAADESIEKSTSNATSMDVDAAAPPAATGEKAAPVKEKRPAWAGRAGGEPLPEADVYVRLLIIVGLMDNKHVDQAYEFAKETAAYIQFLNRRSMDHIAAKIYFYFARCAELLKREEEVRPLLLAAQSTAFLRHDEDLQATLINCLLRNYFNSHLYDQADKLVSKITWPESAGNPQSARYLFYLGRVRAIQLNYSSSHECLLNAVRRAPAAHVAPGFYQTVHKYFIVVELLMGDIPERSLFRQPVLRKALVPYFQIVQAVRVGDLEAFQTALTTHASRFHADGTYSLILRLRHNVIKTALRMISLAYSRISLKDICLKLHLDSEEDTEYIVAKAIRDGVIDAEVDHENGWMKSTEVGDLYGTDEPRKRFQARIDYCNQLHNESVKAMRYPLNGPKPDLEDSELVRERQLDIEQALQEMDDEDMF
ncbi:26S proteasome non-ATPase regulatory subunit [Naganishia albida]|nr:26S proteasome non-ATPase regulatory subunit [Naganishia albida]